jgi:hypothetical protein
MLLKLRREKCLANQECREEGGRNGTERESKEFGYPRGYFGSLIGCAYEAYGSEMYAARVLHVHTYTYFTVRKIWGGSGLVLIMTCHACSALVVPQG